MSGLRAWLRGSSAGSSKSATPANPSPAGSTVGLNGAPPLSPTVRQEISDLEDAMAAAELIMNDDVEGAEERLRKRMDKSSFHQLGLGVSTFLRSILGFEKEVMAQAASRLADCEGQAWDDMKKAQKEARGSSWYGRSSAAAAAEQTSASNLYPPGTEYELVHAEAQLMSAVVAVMTESLTEGIKGFYKLRKAFLALDAIMETEARIMKQYESKANGKVSDKTKPEDDVMPGSFDDAEFVDLGEAEKHVAENGKQSNGDAGVVDSPDNVSGAQTLTSTGSPTLEKTMPDLQLTSTNTSRPETPANWITPTHSRNPSLSRITSQPTPRTPPRRTAVDGAIPDSDIFTTTVDVFVHSGANMCYGILLLILAMVPPAFSRLLYIIGFKGDRDRGVQLLWQSTRYPNINGAIAALVLIAYYNGLMGFADILPTDKDIEELADDGEIVGYPQGRCRALLADVRARYPASRLWKVEEARVHANAKRLDDAIAMLQENKGGKMRQITAVNNFELSINSMFALRWQDMRTAYLRAIELNNWSHAIYYYDAGAADLEMYRDAVHAAAALAGDEGPDAARRREELESEARRHKKNAEENFRKTPTVAGRKKFMSRQIPFEVFACRKVQKWEDRAKAMGIDLADAVGTSPAIEMLWLWNGPKRMNDDVLQRAMIPLQWERLTTTEENIATIREEKDEVAIKAICEAAFLRKLGRIEDAKEVLEPVLKLDRLLFKGPGKDDYSLPAAHYERAVLAWDEACTPSCWPEKPEDIEEYRKTHVDEAQRYLDTVSKWETFVLDARLGMRVKVGTDSIKWLKGKKSWA